MLSDGAREVQAYLIANPHADSTLIGYVPDAKLGFVTGSRGRRCPPSSTPTSPRWWLA